MERYSRGSTDWIRLIKWIHHPSLHSPMATDNRGHCTTRIIIHPCMTIPVSSGMEVTITHSGGGDCGIVEGIHHCPSLPIGDQTSLGYHHHHHHHHHQPLKGYMPPVPVMILPHLIATHPDEVHDKNRQQSLEQHHEKLVPSFIAFGLDC